MIEILEDHFADPIRPAIWLPIETAPKAELDEVNCETIILGHASAKWVIVGHWDPEFVTHEGHGAWVDEYMHDYLSPTHWMPFPEPPQ